MNELWTRADLCHSADYNDEKFHNILNTYLGTTCEWVIQNYLGRLSYLWSKRIPILLWVSTTYFKASRGKTIYIICDIYDKVYQLVKKTSKKKPMSIKKVNIYNSIGYGNIKHTTSDHQCINISLSLNNQATNLMWHELCQMSNCVPLQLLKFLLPSQLKYLPEIQKYLPISLKRLPLKWVRERERKEVLP